MHIRTGLLALLAVLATATPATAFSVGATAFESHGGCETTANETSWSSSEDHAWYQSVRREWTSECDGGSDVAGARASHEGETLAGAAVGSRHEGDSRTVNAHEHWGHRYACRDEGTNTSHLDCWSHGSAFWADGHGRHAGGTGVFVDGPDSGTSVLLSRCEGASYASGSFQDAGWRNEESFGGYGYAYQDEVGASRCWSRVGAEGTGVTTSDCVETAERHSWGHYGWYGDADTFSYNAASHEDGAWERSCRSGVDAAGQSVDYQRCHSRDAYTWDWSESYQEERNSTEANASDRWTRSDTVGTSSRSCFTGVDESAEYDGTSAGVRAGHARSHEDRYEEHDGNETFEHHEDERVVAGGSVTRAGVGTVGNEASFVPER